MDKKELNDLIDRVVLTGPGGVDKIKKILKEIVNGDDGGSNSSSDSGCTCLPPMIVEGTFDDEDRFVPNDGQPTYAEAKAHFLAGGLVFASTSHPLFGLTMTLFTGSNSVELTESASSLRWRDPALPPIQIDDPIPVS